MDKTLFLLLPVLLTACATAKEPPAHQYLTLSISGANNDLEPDIMPLPHYENTILVSTDKGESTLMFPFAYAIECNEGRTTCKHAAVKTELTYSVTNINEGAITISGVVNSQMGRTVDSMNGLATGSHQYLSISVHESVDVISETTVARPFTHEIRAGEQFEVEGLAGVRLIFGTTDKI